MPFEPTEFEPDAPPLVFDTSGARWQPILHHECSFDSEAFDEVMKNLIWNPNLNSTWLCRADILYDSEEADCGSPTVGNEPRPVAFNDLQLSRTLVRRMVPKNTRRDRPMDQTCLFFGHVDNETRTVRSLVVYVPHETSSERMPYYHPKVRGVAHMHEWDPKTCKGSVSMHYNFFQDQVDQDIDDEKLRRTARMLLSTLHKHGQGKAAGYVKRVNHDVVVPKVPYQDRYTALKLKYAKLLIDTWSESTDPNKHVFEDLGIAAFLIELWADMYRDREFPGFVDIGCGNGLLVYILLEEGYRGWGFDARTRKSWAVYGTKGDVAPGSGESLQRRVLLPSLVPRPESNGDGDLDTDPSQTHDGIFPDGTFIISNHADELTPWTPILATLSNSPFIMIPCCSHGLGGAKYRAPPPKDKSKGQSVYASLVDWVSRISGDCGWEVETEMLRIPSTRNTGLLGRRRTKDANDVDVRQIVNSYGGTADFFKNAMKLVKVEPRGH